MSPGPNAGGECDHWVGRGSGTMNSGAGGEGVEGVKGDDAGDVG